MPQPGMRPVSVPEGEGGTLLTYEGPCGPLAEFDSSGADPDGTGLAREAPRKGTPRSYLEETDAASRPHRLYRGMSEPPSSVPRSILSADG